MGYTKRRFGWGQGGNRVGLEMLVRSKRLQPSQRVKGTKLISTSRPLDKKENKKKIFFFQREAGNQ